MTREEFHKCIDDCVRCGSCKTTCPTYELHHNETMSGRGRIAILKGILSGTIPPSESALAKLFSCLQCGACADNCPPGINIPEILYTGRTYLRTYDRSDRWLRFFAIMALKHPDMMFRTATVITGTVSRYLQRRGLVPEGFSLPGNSFKQTPQVIHPDTKRGRVAIFKGCSTNYLFPYMGRKLVNTLVKLGYEVIMPRSEVCCGAPFRTLGMESTARTYARKNVEIFGRLKADAVISLCPTCVRTLKHEYPSLIHADVGNAMDIASFVINRCDVDLMKGMTKKVFYHDPCHMLYGLKVTHEPREILKRCGLNPVDTLFHACCGFGGTYSTRFPVASMKQATERSTEIERTGTEVVYTSCPGCILQLKKTLRKIEIHHIVEAIDGALI